MKKTFIPFLACAMAAVGLAGCGETPAPTPEEPTPLAITSLAISNKEELTAEWLVGTAQRTLTFKFEGAVVNPITELQRGALKITSSDTTVIAVSGMVITALKQGDATITATYGTYTDSVKISPVKFDVAKVDESNMKTTTDFILDKCKDLSNYKEIELPKNENASIRTGEKIKKINRVIIDVYGKYNNLKVYAGTDATGTEIKNPATGSGTGTTYTYMMNDADSAFILNPSSYNVDIYSVTVYYTAA